MSFLGYKKIKPLDTLSTMPSPSPSPEPCSPAESETNLWKTRWLYQSLRLCRAFDPTTGGWLEQQEAALLCDLACSLLPNSTAVEVGSFMGKASRYLAVGTLFSGSKLFCIDPFDSTGIGEQPHMQKLFQRYHNTLGACVWNMDLVLGEGLDTHVTFLATTSKEGAATLKKDKVPVDLLFIDGNHQEAYQDYLTWEPRMAEHGMICLHDTICGGTYGPDGPDNTRFRMLQEHGWRVFSQQVSIAALTRDTEYWSTRIKSFSDYISACSHRDDIG